MEYGLIGNPLGHSYSEVIHNRLHPYSYELHPLEETQLHSFMTEKNFSGINVTIPYKEKVMKYCDELSELAKRVGSVNTIVNKNGKLYGYNTDCDGFRYCAKRAGIDFRNKNIVILGSGGTSKTARTVVADDGCRSLRIVSRNGTVRYDNVYEVCKDAQILINTTPVGMFPHSDETPVDLSRFPHCEAVMDVIYNPGHTLLLQQAEDLGLRSTDGLPMLVAQAKAAGDLFLGEKSSDALTEKVLRQMRRRFMNYIFIGMPGSGKSTLAKAVAKQRKMECADTDEEIENRVGMSVERIFASFGEEFFRKTEVDVTDKLTAKTGLILSVGGGTVLREENRRHIRRNGIVFHIKRDIGLLSSNGRPLSGNEETLARLERERMPIYESLADYTIDNNGMLSDAVRIITDIISQTE